MEKVRTRPTGLLAAAAVVAGALVVLGLVTGGPVAGRDLPSPFQDGASPASVDLAPVAPLPDGAVPGGAAPGVAAPDGAVPGAPGGSGRITGTAAGLAPDDVLWAFAVAVPDTGRGHVPLADACVRDESGAFACGAVPPEVGASYDLLVVRATEAAANEVIQFLASAPAGAGLAELPDGMQQIGVTEVRGS